MWSLYLLVVAADVYFHTTGTSTYGDDWKSTWQWAHTTTTNDRTRAQSFGDFGALMGSHKAAPKELCEDIESDRVSQQTS